MAGKTQKTQGFESAMIELEQIVADMEAVFVSVLRRTPAPLGSIFLRAGTEAS